MIPFNTTCVLQQVALYSESVFGSALHYCGVNRAEECAVLSPRCGDDEETGGHFVINVDTMVDNPSFNTTTARRTAKMRDFNTVHRLGVNLPEAFSNPTANANEIAEEAQNTENKTIESDDVSCPGAHVNSSAVRAEEEEEGEEDARGGYDRPRHVAVLMVASP